ncbi:MAG TPA: glycosyl hydrolase family 18 protein [Solirubrobacteraceae bacterium]|jgi:spore germination protein YaaH
MTVGDRDRRIGPHRALAEHRKVVLWAAAVVILLCGALAAGALAGTGGPVSTGAPARTAGAGHAKRMGGASHLRRPARVRRPRLLARSGTRVRIGWRRAHRGSYAIGGYRIMRDGAVVGETHRLYYTLRVSTGRSHRVSVVAVDVRGHLGSPSPALTIGALHAPAARKGGAPSVPGSLSVSDIGDEAATVWWLPSAPGGARIVGYRVYRDDRLIGQVKSTSMRLTHLSSLRTYAIAVSAVDADKRESARTPAFRLTTTHTPPAGPALISAERVTDTSATLSWQAGSANGARLVGYLLFEDGKPSQVVHGQVVTVKLASQRSYVFTVRALDSAGYLSSPAPNLTVLTTHTPPSTPGGLTAGTLTYNSVALDWLASIAVSGRIVGYRVFRDGIPVGQVATPGLVLSSLAPSSSYQVTVVAVDSLGAISAPTPALAVQTTPPVQSHGTAQAFLLASTDQSFYDLEAHYQQIGVVYPTYFDCGPAGTITGRDDPLITGWSVARGIAVMPRLNCQNPGDENQILNEPAAQQAMISQLASMCSTYGYQGIQVDFEGAQPTERSAFTAFITALAARLHAQGDKLSTVVTAKYYNITSGRAAMYDDAALSVPSDYLFVLDWGLHWTTSGPGGLDELPWFKRVAEYTATMPNRSKFILGMPMYGIDWPGGGGGSNPGTPLEYNNVTALMSTYGITPEWNAEAADPHFSYTDANHVQHSVWYTDQQSVGIRVALAQSLGLGVGLWHLGSEDQSIWELPGLGS